MVKSKERAYLPKWKLDLYTKRAFVKSVGTKTYLLLILWAYSSLDRPQEVASKEINILLESVTCLDAETKAGKKKVITAASYDEKQTLS